ncbi:MAG: tRNA (cytidine(56)-2'-O)-methyltransferase [Aeropyrum sp.]|nr:tRNA (cytidine(56)-2'-O)-methyltransferase [Aeropyrum sp.]
MKPGGPYGRVYVLRLGHRPGRDKRVTTHVALVARAFGANGLVLAGVCDESVQNSVRGVVERWGGPFHFECGVSARRYLESWRSAGGEVVHLTMYGIHVDDIVGIIASSPKPKLVVVGAEKVDRFYFDVSDFNVSIGTQPHSEVAALAVFLDRLFRGSWRRIDYEGGRLGIVESPRGKRVEEKG